VGVKEFLLPVCDKCGEAWLPEKGPARRDIRGHDAVLRGKGKVGVRCGKCKSPNWDDVFRKGGGVVGPVAVEVAVSPAPGDEVTDLPTGPDMSAPACTEDLVLVERMMTAAAGSGHMPKMSVSHPAPGGAKLCRHRMMHCPVCAT